MGLWLQFIACSGLILYAGTQLTRYGDVIAEKTKLGRTWIGVIMLASVTSLPELITGISSVALFDLPDIAAGNVIGACMLNLSMISCLDIIGGRTPIYAKAHQGQVLTAGFGILMLGLTGFGIFMGSSFPAVGWIGAYSPVTLGIYFIAMRMIFLYEKRRYAEFVKELAEEARYRKVSKPFAFWMFGANALLIVAAATYLPRLGERIADETGLEQMFIGSIFIAFSTTLPELVVSVAALRMGAVDMAVGNLFGSNLFNLSVLAIDDLIYSRGPLLSYVSQNHLVSAVAAMTMTAIAVIGLTYRPGRKPLLIGWDSMGILTIYVFTTLALYFRR